MIGFPFDSHVTFESDGTPVYDRAITSAPLRKLIAKLLTDGVLPNPSTNLQVEAGSGMNVIVNPGFAICAGGLKLEENQRTLAIQAADSNYDRIDTVVLRWNDNDSERICDLYIVEGTPAASPLRPTLTRTESIWELGLADLFINKNSSAISNQRITDTRYETARCGIISAISEFDTTTLYQQVQADLAGFKASEQADFIAWFNDIKGQLSEDAAGNLQNQIGTLEALKTEVKTNLVNALNWVVDKTSGVIAKLGSADISKIGDGTVTGAIVNNKEAIEEVTQSLTTENGTKFRFGQTSNGEYGYILNKDGADTVIPFKKGGIGSDHDYLFLGGLQKVIFTTNEYSSLSGFAAGRIRPTHLECASRGTTKQIVGTSKPVDLTKYSAIIAVLDTSSSDWTKTVDISSLTGDYYIAVASYINGYGNTYFCIYIGKEISSLSLYLDANLGYNQSVGYNITIGQIYFD